jgi:hypothetical protein
MNGDSDLGHRKVCELLLKKSWMLCTSLRAQNSQFFSSRTGHKGNEFLLSDMFLKNPHWVLPIMFYSERPRLTETSRTK